MSTPSEEPPKIASKSDGSRSPYIAGRAYDWAFFLLPPSLALVAGVLISGTWWSREKIWFAGEKTTLGTLILGTFINAHLVAVFFRSHGNPAIFRRHRLRFLLVPLLLYAAMLTSMWVLVSVTVLAVFWDVYHSALQTFGLARIYDRNLGNDPTVGRRLDLWLNHLLYAGPIVAGATMLDHFKKFELFEDVDATYFTAIPAFMKTNQRYFTWTVLALGTLFLAYYVLAYVRLHRRGYRVPFLKVFLLASTGLCSIYTWGFNTWGEAFFIMNIFHGMQYLGLVWWSERRLLVTRLRLGGLRVGVLIELVVFLLSVLAYGLWAHAMVNDIKELWCVTQVVAILHFWYDGFIWSVTKKQI